MSEDYIKRLEEENSLITVKIAEKEEILKDNQNHLKKLNDQVFNILLTYDNLKNAYQEILVRLRNKETYTVDENNRLIFKDSENDHKFVSFNDSNIEVKYVR